ncbi:unnamed protein product [Pylaiella littoralis]
MTYVGPEAFSNNVMLNSNPRIETYSQNQFNDPTSHSHVASLLNLMSQEAYVDPKYRRSNIGGFKLDRTLSDSRHAIYSHGYTGRVVQANRGSANLSDVAHDVVLALGAYGATPDAKKSIKKYQEVQKKYGKTAKYHLTGHSYGGFVSSFLHRKHPYSTASSTSFNEPGSIPGVFSSLIQRTGYRTKTQRKVHANHASFVNTLDPVSAFSRHRKGVKTKKSFHSTHIP